tara:strand:+ start:121 stop:1527 length:1407 start_codon:yes stop_codon:yes gene_type:complete
MAIEEVIKDEYSDENFAPEGDSAYIDKKGDFNYDQAETQAEKDAITLGSGVQNMEDFQVESRQTERLKGEALEILPTLKKENDKLKFELGNALKTIEAVKTPPKKDLIDIDTSSLSSFTSSVGKSFMNLASVIPNKIEEISKDPKKKRNLMRGLEIIEASSGIKPIGQSTSDLGAISRGLLKAEKGFIASDIAMEKAKKRERRRYPTPGENLLVDSMKDYKERQQFKSDLTKSVNERFNIVKKVAIEGKELPTGILNSSFRDLKGILQEIGLGEKYDALAKKFAADGYTQMTLEDQNVFNDLFQAATFEQVVQDVKKLYPVSNKDIDTLLKTKGDISTRPEALRKLVATQMAINDIAMQSEEYAYKYFEIGDQQFEKKSIQMSEKMIGEKLRKEGKVTSETLTQLFGTDKDITDAGYITAHYYQQLLAQKSDGAGDSFSIFVTAEKNKKAEIDKIIDGIQNDDEDNKN